MKRDSLKILHNLLNVSYVEPVVVNDLLSDSSRQSLSLGLWGLLKNQANLVMTGSRGGLNYAEAADLAAAALEKLVYAERPSIMRFDGGSYPELVSFVRTTLKRMLIDDQRRLYGRAAQITNSGAQMKATPTSYPDSRGLEIEGGQEFRMPEVGHSSDLEPVDGAKAHVIGHHVPRVFVDVSDEDGNEFLKSNRRSATGYLLLKQTKQHLHEYLNLMPGSVVMVSCGVRGDHPRVKRVRLNRSHALLLRLWMSGEGEDQWQDLAAQMNRPLGTVKRWWSEAVLAFLSDNSVQASALRGLYRINPAHSKMASQTINLED